MALCRQFDGFLEREVDGEILLLDTESNLIHQLNRTASFIWRKWQEGASPEEIADVLEKEFEVEQAKARSDVEQTVAQLERIGMKRSADVEKSG